MVSTWHDTTEPDLSGVRIVSVTRLNNSVNGNPRFMLELDNGREYMTSSDASCSYEVDNYARSGDPFDAWLTKAGRIQVIDKAK